MSCFSPNYMLDLGIKPNGKRLLKMLPRRADSNYESLCFQYGKKNILPVRCGHCLGCKLDKAKEWAFRCVCEASEYGDNNSFVTLTYDDDHLVEHLSKDHFKKFIKSLRNRGYDIRYFGCGEYASRPHYHLILFNYFPQDRKIWDSKKCLFTSEELQDCWPYGRVIVGYVSYQSAGYVARYTLKKKFSDQKTDEFVLMSLKPGIGQKYILQHANDYADRDFFVKFIGSNNTIIKHFRYADKVLDNAWYDISHLKEKRVNDSDTCSYCQKVLYGLSHIDEINSRREVQKINQVSKLKRSVL